MRKVFGLLLLAAVLGFAFRNPIQSVTVNPAESSITWKAYKVTGQHDGTVGVKSGELQMEDGQLVGGMFEIDMTSIAVADLKGGMKGKLEGHLKSPDFFSVEEHPSAAFKITKVISRGTPGDYKVIGDLTIKGITKEIKFIANVKEEGGKTVASADMKIDRSEFNVRYGSGSFFDDLGDKTIYDDFDLSVTLVAGN